MSFVLDGVISKEEIRNMFISEVYKDLVARSFIQFESVLDAESIKIYGVGEVAVVDYAGTAVTTDATDTSVVLTLDQAKYFQKAIDRIDNAQAAVKILSPVLEKGAVSTAEAIDEFVFSILAGASNTVPTIALSDANVVSWISSMSVKLSNLKAPKAGRQLAVSPEMGALLVDAGMQLMSDSVSTEAARTGFIGRFYGFDIYETLSLTDGTNGKMAVATVKEAGYVGIGYQEYSVGRPTEGFKDIAKGLANYGAQISQEAMVVACDVSIA